MSSLASLRDMIAEAISSSSIATPSNLREPLYPYPLAACLENGQPSPLTPPWTPQKQQVEVAPSRQDGHPKQRRPRTTTPQCDDILGVAHKRRRQQQQYLTPTASATEQNLPDAAEEVTALGNESRGQQKLPEDAATSESDTDGENQLCNSSFRREPAEENDSEVEEIYPDHQRDPKRDEWLASLRNDNIARFESEFLVPEGE
jgi:hypothetical protein